MIQLIWHGPFAGQSGYEVITRGILVELDKMGIQIALDESPIWNQERIPLDLDVEFRFRRMMRNRVLPGTPAIMHQRKQLQLTNKLAPNDKRYVYTLFETDKMPSPWIEELKEMDGIFTFSNFNKEGWSKNSGFPKDKIHVLPWGVEKEFVPDGPKANILNKKGFTFLANGDFVERKNFELLIEAFTKEFKPHEKVCLVLKTHFGGFTIAHKRALLERIKGLATSWVDNPPKILFLGDKITTQDMANLYRTCDCLVLPSKGEGLGLPVIEAMACGLPVIATDWSSLSELGFQGDKLYATVDQIDSVEFIRKCPEALNHNWGQVHVEELMKSLRYIFDNQAEAKEKGKINSEITREKTWHDAAVKILKVIFGGGKDE